MNIKNITDVENYFADHFDTVLFPILAEHYLSNNDFDRAHKVCAVGLKHHPDSQVGWYIEAKTFMAEGDLINAEKIFKKIIKMDSGYYSAYVLLAEVQESLDRADSTLKRVYSKILKFDSRNENALARLGLQEEKTEPETIESETTEAVTPEPDIEESEIMESVTSEPDIEEPETEESEIIESVTPEPDIEESETVEAVTVEPDIEETETMESVTVEPDIEESETTEPDTTEQVVESPPEPETPEEITSPEEAPPEKPAKNEFAGLKISPELATFTLVKVLKSQNLYAQALEVLAVMSEKRSVDSKRVDEERNELKKLLTLQRENE